MSRHLLIAGTGRAGTSFLVRYLTALGLDTHLSRLGPDAEWNDAANAGLEDIPLPDASDLPYVIKSPWSYQVIAETLRRGSLQFDAAIVPMRDLMAAATSRTILERQDMHRQRPWMAELDRPLDDWGITPGGVVYSLSPLDQARLLATGFHHLLERLVAADVPIVLLSFPRLVQDPDYLYLRLAPVLPKHVTRDQAAAEHARIADPGKVRVGSDSIDSETDVLDRAAMARRLRALRDELTAARSHSARTDAAMADLTTAHHRQLAELRQERDRAIREAEAARSLLQSGNGKPRGGLLRRIFG